jgi:hypothetical protein
VKLSPGLIPCAVVCAAFLYAGSYLSLSWQGRDEPEMIGLSGVKLYGWAPAGFVHDYKWNHSLQLFFLPVYLPDKFFWHKSSLLPESRYPVDVVPRKISGRSIWPGISRMSYQNPVDSIALLCPAGLFYSDA